MPASETRPSRNPSGQATPQRSGNPCGKTIIHRLRGNHPRQIRSLGPCTHASPNRGPKIRGDRHAPKISSEEVISRIQGFAITPDRKKLVYQAGRSDFGITDVRPGQDNEAGRLDLDGMNLRIDPKVEWAQIYHDAWILMRGWFYDPGMHGVDWEAMYDRYLPLIPYVAHRADLDYVITELIGELNVGHAYSNSSPEQPAVERVGVGLLGAEFEAGGGRYRISNIFPGENWHEEYRSPLTEPGVAVDEGDYLIAIDGEDITTEDNPYAFLVGKADRTVEITVSEEPDGQECREEDRRGDP